MLRSADRTMCAALAVASVAAATLTARRAGADDGFDARIEYHAPAPCLSDAALVAKVTERVPRFRRTETATRRFTLDVTATDGGFRGRLTTFDPLGARAEREVSAASCDDAVGALVLVLALAVDPSALFVAPVAPSNDPSPPAPIVPDAPSVSAPSVATTPGSGAGERPPVAPAHDEPAAWAVGGGAIVARGQADAALAGAALFVERGFAWGRFRPVFRAGVARTWSDTIEIAGSGAARFTWTVGSLDGCPVELASGRWTLTPCVRVDAGVLAGSGSNIAHPRDDAKAWLDAGAVLRGAWTFARPVFVGIEAGGLVPLLRPRFHFDAPEVTVSTPAAVGAVAAVHVGGRFL